MVLAHPFLAVAWELTQGKEILMVLARPFLAAAGELTQAKDYLVVIHLSLEVRSQGIESQVVRVLRVLVVLAVVGEQTHHSQSRDLAKGVAADCPKQR